MDEIHKQMVEELFSKSSFYLAEHGSISPLYIIVTNDNVTYVLDIPQNINFKEYSSLAISKAHDIGAKALILICEEFVVTKKKNDPVLNSIISGVIKVSDHPDSKKFLALMYMSDVGEKTSIISEIHTDMRGTRYNRDHRWINGHLTNIMVPWKRA